MKTLHSLLVLLSFTLLSNGIFAGGGSTYSIDQGGTITGCSGTFTDAGGNGNYANGENFTITFCSSSGGPISLDFTGFGFQVETNFDFLDIYDGTTTTGTPMYQSVTTGGAVNPGIITSTTGCLTIQFQSDGSVTYEGWEATISCPTCTDGIQNGNETGIDCGGPDCPACPNCYNGIQDGNETGVDCGGSCPEPCHCSDGIQNFDETGVDCGGADCFQCPEPCEVTASYEVLTGVLIPGGCCDYTLTMNDSWGDGWNGASVSINGTAYTFTTGSVSTAAVTLCHGDAIDIDYTASGSFPSEVSYTFSDPDGNVLYSSGSGPAVANNVYAGTASCTTLGLDCNGGDVTLTAEGQGAFTYVLNNDFDLGTPGSGWNTNITADFSNPCDPSLDGGTYMWMGNSAPHPRIIETTPMDVSCGGTICFLLDFATQGNASPCEGIDLADEGVFFEYSTDGGTTWTTIEYFGPGGVGNNTTGGGTDPQMTAWNSYCFDIPPGAETPNTLFHWAQTGSSGLNNDHWGIDNVTIQSLVDCSPYYYDWAQVPGSPDNATQNENLSSTTTYTVTYTNGTTDACSTTVTVPVPPGTTADAGPDITVCEGDPGNTIGGDPVTIDDGATYSWDNGAGSGTISLTGGSQDNGQVTVAPATTTEYILAVTFNGCTTEDTMLYTVNPLPVVSGGPDVSICNGASTTLTASGADTYTWAPATGLSATTGTSVTANPTVTTTYTVTGTDANGCINTATVTVTVDPLDDPSFTLTDFCLGAANAATVTGTAGGTFTFNPAPGDGATIDGVSGAISNGVAGTTYTVEYTTAGACPLSSTQTVTVNPLPVIDVPDFTFCAGAVMTVNESGAGDPTWTYAWTSNGAATFGNASAQTTGITGAVDGEQFTVTVTDANGCVNTDIATLTISGNAPIDAGPDVTICDGVATTLTATGGVTYTWDDGTGAPGAGNGLSVTPSTTTTYTVVGTDAAGCSGTDQMIVTVDPIPTVDPVADQVLCANAATTDVNFTGSVVGTTYDWTNDNTNIGLAASGSGDILSFTGTNAGTTAETATITVTPTANGCVGTPITFTITIDPIPTVDPILAQVLCANTATTDVNFTGAVAGTTYDWTNDNTNTGLGASGSGDITSFTGTNAGSVSEVSTITVTPTANGCVGLPETFTITVDPIPTVDPVADQTLCNNPVTADVIFTGAVAGTTYDWTNDNTSIGLAASGTGDILSFTAVNTGSTTQVATITVTPTANGCVGTPITFTYTVFPIPTVDPFVDQVLCAGDATTAIVPTGAVAGTTFDWTNDNTNIGLGASGTGNIASFAPTAGTTVEVATITYTPTANGCTGAPESFTITVNPIPTVDAVADQTLCNNPVTADVIFSGAVPGTTYDWTNDNTSIGLAASGTGDILSFTAVNTGSATEVATVTVTPSLNGCVGTPITFTYTVFPIPTVDPFTDQVLCTGDATAAIVPTGAVAGTTFDWTNDNTNIGLGASGSGNIASFAGTATTTTEVATITYMPTANGCAGAPESFTITVNPIPTVDPVADQTLCNNPTTTDVIFTGAVAGTTYDWTNDNTSIGLAASGTGDILSFTAVNTGSTTQVATITVTPTANGCVGTPITFTYTVFPIPTVDPFADQVLCAGDATTAIVPTGAVAGTTYDWTNDNVNIGLGASGTGNIASFAGTATTTTEVATITYTPTANGCTGAPESFTITVNPIPTVDPVADQVLCHNSATTDVNFTGAVVGTSYDWTSDNTSIGLAASGSGDILSFTATNTGAGPEVATITVTPSANGCTGTPISFTITVNPIPNVDPIADQTLCEGDATAGVNFTGVVTGTSYDWTNDNTATGLGANGNGNIASFTAVNSSPTAEVSTITVTPSANGCVGTPETFTITVNPLPTAVISGTVTLCEGDPDPTVTITGSEGVAPYTFEYNLNGGATQTITSDLAGIATITVPSSPAGTYNYNLLSVTDASGTTCSQVQTGTATVTVNPNPVPVIVGPTDYCTGTFATLTTSTAYSTYNWSTGATTASVNVTAADNPITVTVTDVNGCSATSPVFTVTENAVITYNETIEICDGQSATIHGSIETVAGVYSQTYTTPSGCDSTANITLVVNPLPAVDAGLDQELCDDGTQVTLVASGAQTYVWDTGVSNGVQFPPALGVTVHTVTGTDANGCVNTDQVTVTVNPLPTATIAGTNTICVGDGGQTITFTGANGTAPYTFTYTLNGGLPQTITSTGNTATIAVSDAVAGTWSYDLVSVEDATATTCSQAQVGNATVIINPLPTATISGTIDICVGDGDQTITFTGADGTAPYTFSYTLNGGAPQTIVSTGNTATITVSDATAGTFSYDLIGVQDASSTACSQVQVGNATVVVNPLPTAVIAGTIDICEGDADPVVTFTGANGTAPYTFTYNINGAANQTIVSNGAGVATITVSSAITGTFDYNLVSVVDASSTACSQVQTGTATVVVNPMPTATIAGTAMVCEGSIDQTITFTGANGTAPYTFTYTLNGGAPQTIVSTGNTATITIPGTSVGVFSYDLISVQDASSTTCGQPQAGNATVTINPGPTASIAGTIDVCEGDTDPVVTITGANGTEPYTFTYTLNNGPTQTITSTGPTSTITVSTATPGTYSYELTSVTDASPTACTQVLADIATVVVNPLPTATIAGTANICVGDGAQTITFTGANGTAPYTFTYSLNGGAAQTIVSTGNTATITVSDATDGSWSYDLIGVEDASSTTCYLAQTGNATVVVNPLPTATIAGTTTLCVGDPAATITFTGANGTAPYTFTYNVNNGPNQTITSTGNTATITVPTGSVLLEDYNLVSVQDASSTSCSQAQPGTATVTVNPLPTATIGGDVTVCVGDVQPTITFTGANGTAPYTFTYTINGVAQPTITSVGNTATVLAPTGTAGTFAYDLVSVQDASVTACSQAQTGTATVIVNPLPTATIAGTIDVCENDPQPTITFTGANGTAPYTFTYTMNGTQATVTSTGNVATVSVPTNVPGTYTYTLQEVRDSSPTGCSQFQTGVATVVVNPLPTATIAGDVDLCIGAAQPSITFTGATGTAPYTFTYTINGGAAQTVTSTGNTATVLAPTATAGSYVYELVSVQDASTTACSQPQTGTATVNVNPLPTATIAGDAEVCIGAGSPVITFTGAGSTAPYTFEYSIDNGPVQTVTSTGGNSATILASTANAGTFTYDLISVTDGSATGCSQVQTGTVTIIVNPLPTATIAGDAQVCLNGPDQTITFTGANGTAPYTFTYTVNGGPNQTITSTGNTATITVPASAVGVTTFSLVGVQDASATACYQPQTGLASVEVVGLPPIYAGVDFSVCEGDDIVLTASGGTGYVWNGGAVQDGVPFPATQTDTFVVIGVNPTGCINSDTMVVTVNPLPLPSFVADTTVGCAPLEVTFTNTTPGQTVDCIWTLSNGAILNGCGSVSYVFEQGGTYDVTLQTTTLEGCTAQATYQYYIYVEQPAIADFSPSSSVVSTLDSEVQFNNESQNADGYIWSFGDGSAISTEENPIHVFPNEEFGTYGVTLIATTPLGCNDTAYVVIKVEEELIFYVPNTFTPDDDDYNPTFQPVFTSGYDPFDYTLLIFNRWGEIVFESHNVDIGWDGTYGVDGQKVEVQDGTYTWTIEFKTVNTDERVYVNGHVNVLR